MGLLSLAIWLPIAAGVVLLALGRDEHAEAVRWAALLAALASFLVTLPLITGFDAGTAAMQFQREARLDRSLQRALPRSASTASRSGSCCSPRSSRWSS